MYIYIFLYRHVSQNWVPRIRMMRLTKEVDGRDPEQQHGGSVPVRRYGRCFVQGIHRGKVGM